MNKKLAVIAFVVLLPLITAAKCADVPAGSDRGDSAGNNQPDNLPACAITAQQEKPAAKIEDGKYVYDVYVELWDEGCTSAAMADELANDSEGKKPVHIYINGTITDTNGREQEADYLGDSRKEKDVDTPYHLRAFVSPRNAPHQMTLVASVNRGARSWVDESLPDGFLHCRITRDSRPIVVAKGSRDRVSDTVKLQAGRGQVNCHFFVGVT